MDLGTVKKNLLEHKYINFKEFLDDINLIWSNCRTYNLPGSDIVKMANHCEKIFNKNLDKTFRNYNKKKVNKNDNEKYKDVELNSKVKELEDKLTRFFEYFQDKLNSAYLAVAHLLHIDTDKYHLNERLMEDKVYNINKKHEKSTKDKSDDYEL